MEAVIWHNPRCGSSRNTLALLRHAGVEPVVVEYLKQVPGKDELAAMIAAAGISVREAIRSKETVYTELGLANPSLDDAALLEAMVSHPILINRPFVRTGLGTRLCRPAETVLEILPPLAAPFAKEDGTVVGG